MYMLFVVVRGLFRILDIYAKHRHKGDMSEQTTDRIVIPELKQNVNVFVNRPNLYNIYRVFVNVFRLNCMPMYESG